MIHRPIRYYYYKMLRQRSTPHQLAAGAAIGVFTGLAVPYGLQIVFILVAALLFRGFNRIAALLGCTVSNPLTTPFLYLAYFHLGKWITGFRLRSEITTSPDPDTVWSMLLNFKLYQETLTAMGLAALIIATIAATVTYFSCRKMIVSYRLRRKQRLQETFKLFIAKAKSLAHLGSNEKQDDS